MWFIHHGATVPRQSRQQIPDRFAGLNDRSEDFSLAISQPGCNIVHLIQIFAGNLSGINQLITVGMWSGGGRGVCGVVTYNKPIRLLPLITLKNLESLLSFCSIPPHKLT